MILVLSFSNAQDKGYWIWFNIKVDPEGKEAVVVAIPSFITTKKLVEKYLQVFFNLKRPKSISGLKLFIFK